jgi:hypothetical protein
MRCQAFPLETLRKDVAHYQVIHVRSERSILQRDDCVLLHQGKALGSRAHPSMNPRFIAMVTACVRSLAPNFERMLFI